ncbi:hypothetical protein SFUMM280S_08291 [Streptomyces fumanus]
MGAGLGGAGRGGEGAPLGGVGVAGQPVPLPGGPQLPLHGFALDGEVFGAGRGLLGGLDVVLEGGAGGVPGREPALGLGEEFLVGAFVAVECGAFPDESGEPVLGAAGRLQAAQFLGGPAGGGGQPGRPGVREAVGQQGPGAGLGAGRPPVFGLGGVPQLQRGGDGLRLAGPLHPLPGLPVGARPARPAGRPAPVPR